MLRTGGGSIWPESISKRRSRDTTEGRDASSPPARSRAIPAAVAGITPRRIGAELAWSAWCTETDLDVFAVRHVHIELWTCWMEKDRRLARVEVSDEESGATSPWPSRH